jgi:hypothetical protein
MEQVPLSLEADVRSRLSNKHLHADKKLLVHLPVCCELGALGPLR